MKKRYLAVLGLAAAAVLVAAAGGAVSKSKIVYEVDSPYSHIRVVDYPDRRYLKFDKRSYGGYFQSGMLLKEPNKSCLSYTRFFHLYLLFNEAPGRVLFIGLGGGSGPKEFRVAYPDVAVEAVEIDGKVIDVAREYFHVKDASDPNRGNGRALQ